MKKNLLFVLSLFLINIAQAQSGTLRPIAANETCGCSSGCFPGVCDDSGTGNCTAATDAPTFTIPSGQDVEVILNTNNCASTAGLDSSDDIIIQVDGVDVYHPSTTSNEVINHTECIASDGGGDRTLTLSLTANRRDETIDYTVTFFLGGSGCATPLPIELLVFEANLVKDRVDIYWETASELNNDFMAVERSTDGKDFETIQTVKGKSYSDDLMQYEHTDNKPLIGTSYYRLRQVDFDGTTTYHKAVAVRFNSEKTDWIMYPNPANNVFTIAFNDIIEENTTISIIDGFGRVIKDLEVQPGLSQVLLNTAELVPGTYLLQVGNKNSFVSKRFVKL